jgi:D-inositol-3-phosphate glycosyltransferase
VRILISGDAAVPTGFAKATHAMADGLAAAGHDVHILGINHSGNPAHKKYPNYMIYPANPGGQGDFIGVWNTKEMLETIQPSVLIVHNDPWNVREFVQRFAPAIPIIGWMPVDALNCRGSSLNGLAMGVFYTNFALEEARRGGYGGPATVIGLGVDAETFAPIDREEARSWVLPDGKVKKGSFIIGNVNRNQPRKRIDLSIAYFAEWIRTRKIDDAWLYLHMAPTQDKGWDLPQLARYYGIGNRMITQKPHRRPGGVTEAFLRKVYASFDLQINTGLGEGFGLCTLEGMSCGVHQAVGKWAAYPDWCPVADLVECPTISTMWFGINTIGGVPDRQGFLDLFDQYYEDRKALEARARRSYEFTKQPQFSWKDVGAKWAQVVEDTMSDSSVVVPSRDKSANKGTTEGLEDVTMVASQHSE